VAKRACVFHVSEAALIGLNIAKIVRIRKKFVFVFNAVEPQLCGAVIGYIACSVISRGQGMTLNVLADVSLQRRIIPDQCGVLVIDLDNFKQVNDTLGHGIGDELLTLVARRIRTCTRNADTLVRLGGDEFDVVLNHELGKEHIGALSQRLVTLLGQPFLVNGHQVNIAASIGIAALGDLTSNVHDLLKHADLALYEAKKLGRSCYAFFESRLEELALDRRSFELDLRRALGLRQFSLQATQSSTSSATPSTKPAWLRSVSKSKLPRVYFWTNRKTSWGCCGPSSIWACLLPWTTSVPAIPR
jgi:diguanylate cyclase (GGDEF)-like protein